MPDRCKIRFETPVIVGTAIVTEYESYKIIFEGFDPLLHAQNTGNLPYFVSFASIPGEYYAVDCFSCDNEPSYMNGDDPIYDQYRVDGRPYMDDWINPISQIVPSASLCPWNGEHNRRQFFPYQDGLRILPSDLVHVQYGWISEGYEIPVGTEISFYLNPPFEKAGVHLADVTVRSVPAFGPVKLFWQLSQFDIMTFGSPDSTKFPHFYVVDGQVYTAMYDGSDNSSYWDDATYGDVVGVYLAKVSQSFPYFAQQGTWLENAEYEALHGKTASLWWSYPL